MENYDVLSVLDVLKVYINLPGLSWADCNWYRIKGTIMGCAPGQSLQSIISLFIYCRRDHIEREKAWVKSWERNWKFMATNYRCVSTVLSVSA